MTRAIPDNLSGFTYRELLIDRSGHLVDPGQVDSIRAMLDAPATDLVVLSHGWNNDEREAFDLYAGLAAVLKKGIDRRPSSWQHRRVCLLGVFWPSKKFADSDLIPGGAAALDSPEDALRAGLLATLADLKDAFDADDAAERLAAATAVVPTLEGSSAALSAFITAIRGLIPQSASDSEEGSALLATEDPVDVADKITDPTLGDPLLWGVPPSGDTGGVILIGDGPVEPDAGGAAFLGLPDSLTNAARMALNAVTYYQMKERARTCGELGLAPVLQEVVPGNVRLHFAGHSFGARLVTAAVAVSPGPAVSSISLLQAAFSHYSFARDWEPGQDGAFRSVLTAGRLTGPMIITHTHNDEAVGLAYAIASRLAGQVAAEIGDATSRFGGLGSNGAQRTPGTLERVLLDSSADYTFSSSVANNLLADTFIKGHGDVTGPEVGNAVVAAMSATLPG